MTPVDVAITAALAVSLTYLLADAYALAKARQEAWRAAHDTRSDHPAAGGRHREPNGTSRR